MLAPPPEGTPPKDNPYATQRFNIDPVGHTVICPQGRSLDYEGKTTKNGKRVERFRCHHRDCPVRECCTSDPKGRQIEVWPHQAVVQAMRQQLQQTLPLQQWCQRSQIIEPRFAQIKQHEAFRRWTVWGLESVRTQWALLCTTLNLRVLYKKWRSDLKASLEEVLALADKLQTAIWPNAQSKPPLFLLLYPNSEIGNARILPKTF